MNHDYRILKEDDPEQIIQLLEDRIYTYNTGQTNRTDGQLFARTMRDREVRIIAGIAGWTWAGVCEITQFWVEEKLRGNGIGKMLLEAAEAEARGKGCRKILIRTYGFQAPHFYEKKGYKIVFTLSDFPPAHTYHILTKTLDITGLPVDP